MEGTSMREGGRGRWVVGASNVAINVNVVLNREEGCRFSNGVL